MSTRPDQAANGYNRNQNISLNIHSPTVLFSRGSTFSTSIQFPFTIHHHIMPPVPPTIPTTLQSTLSAIRSNVFLSTHNPTGARLGLKYLRRNITGPDMLKWYPKPVPKPSALDGIANSAIRRKEEAYLRAGGERQALDTWKAEGQIAAGYGAVPKLPQAILHDGAFWSLREDRRLRYVDRRKRIGKGTPKKGESRDWLLRCKTDARR